MAREAKELYEMLSNINVNDKVEKKNDLSYLSWAWAWGTFVKYVPETRYEIVKNPITNLPYFNDDEVGAMVFTKVTVGDITHEMWLPVMDSANNAMKTTPYSYTTKWGKEVKVNTYTMFDVNKTIMRCLVKNLAMFCFAIYIFAGEDLPEDSTPNTDYKASQMVVKDKDEKVRENTVLQLTELFEQLEPEQQGKVNSYLLKVSALKFTDLTEAQGRSLLLNIQGLLSKKVAQ